MIFFEKADKSHAYLLSEIAGITCIESHGGSAKPEDINYFIAQKYNPETFTAELIIPKNNYYLVYYQNRLAGFSNIIYNLPYADSKIENIAKLERIFILKEFYDLKLGYHLFEFNRNLARENNQKGMWLFVWKGNERAIKFYKKNGFEVIGHFDYKISETHSNPNYQMFLKL
ncbi:MAG: GNAT family N-acetyltransferase [Ginsengibacter sp.]